jgi:mRNA interferase YafQ
MLRLDYTTQFKKDIKKINKSGKNIKKLTEVIDLLVDEKPLPQKYRDHSLIGNYIGCRECHVEPDWLLIYQIVSRRLVLSRTGSHSQLF